MSCHNQHGPQTYLSFIESETGERITQSDWHAIRELAAAESGGKLSRATAHPDEAHDAALELANCLNYEQGVNIGVDADGDRVEDYRADELVKAVAGVKNTSGTVAAINYLAAHGVTDTLQTVRKKGDSPLAYEGDPFAPKPDDGSPKGLPYMRQEMTQVEADEMVGWLTRQPLAELHKRNAEGYDRMLKAAARGDDEDVLSERVDLDMIADAVSRQNTGSVKAGLHSDMHGELMHKRRFESVGLTGAEAIEAAANEIAIENRVSQSVYEDFLMRGEGETEARRQAIHYITKRDRDEYEAWRDSQD